MLLILLYTRLMPIRFMPVRYGLYDSMYGCISFASEFQVNLQRLAKLLGTSLHNPRLFLASALKPSSSTPAISYSRLPFHEKSFQLAV